VCVCSLCARVRAARVAWLRRVRYAGESIAVH